MNLYVLDTDHLTLFRFGQEAVAARVAEKARDETAITVVSVEEQLRGWYTLIRRARNIDQRERAYQGLMDVVEEVRLFRVLPFNRPALERYDDLRKQLPRLGKMDLAIAATALEHKAIVVTRNRQDFGQVPDLVIEDWTT